MHPGPASTLHSCPSLHLRCTFPSPHSIEASHCSCTQPQVGARLSSERGSCFCPLAGCFLLISAQLYQVCGLITLGTGLDSLAQRVRAPGCGGSILPCSFSPPHHRKSLTYLLWWDAVLLLLSPTLTLQQLLKPSTPRPSFHLTAAFVPLERRG